MLLIYGDQSGKALGYHHRESVFLLSLRYPLGLSRPRFLRKFRKLSQFDKPVGNFLVDELVLNIDVFASGMILLVLSEVDGVARAPDEVVL